MLCDEVVDAVDVFALLPGATGGTVEESGVTCVCVNFVVHMYIVQVHRLAGAFTLAPRCMGAYLVLRNPGPGLTGLSDLLHSFYKRCYLERFFGTEKIQFPLLISTIIISVYI